MGLSYSRIRLNVLPGVCVCARVCGFFLSLSLDISIKCFEFSPVYDSPTCTETNSVARECCFKSEFQITGIHVSTRRNYWGV